MSGQFEESEDANDGEKLQDIRILQVGCLVSQQQVNVKTQCCDEVNDVNGALNKLQYVGTGTEPRNVGMFYFLSLSSPHMPELCKYKFPFKGAGGV